MPVNQINEKDLDVEVDFEREECLVEIRIVTAGVINLLDNAIKFNRPGAYY